MTETTVDSDYGIVLAGHGSRDNDGIQEFEAAVELFKTRNPQKTITHGYLEFASPTISHAVRENVAAGSKRIVMVPTILFAASHGKNDMPIEMLTMQKEFPDVDFQYGGAMELNAHLLKTFQERIIEAEARSNKTVKRSETLLVVVGRGTTDPDTNSNVNKLARMVEEGMGFGSSFVCYSGTAEPLVSEGIEYATTMGFKRLMVIPYFLFTGVLVKRIYAASNAVQANHPEIEIINAQYLGVHNSIAKVWAEKAEEGIAGKATMNCSLCKYRTQIIGFEQETGTVQRAHHLHVRAEEDGGDDSHDHGHDHHHHHHDHSHQQQPAAEMVFDKQDPETYVPHPIEAESFEIIAQGLNWEKFAPLERAVLQRLVHTCADFSIVDNVFFSENAAQVTVDALMAGTQIVTDVTMVQSGLKRLLLSQLGISVFCGVHEQETHLQAEARGMTRSATGIRRAWEKYGDDVILAIGDAPTAVMEAVRLIQEQNWRPRVVIGLPVGFVGTLESKQQLKACVEIPRITNLDNRGGSPWAAAALNALMIASVNQLTTTAA